MTDYADVLRWLEAGEAQLIQRLVDEQADLTGPSLLPGWTRANVAAHLIGNARAVDNLVTWAATGQEVPMYASQQARADQIAADADRPPAWLREQLLESSNRLRADCVALNPAQLETPIRTSQGLERPASYAAWMRVRESHIHLVDLNVGVGFDDMAADVIDALANDAAQTLSEKPTAPDVTLQPTDREQSWQVGDSAGAAVVTGTAADLLGWLLGRPPAADTTLSDRPDLPPWL